MVKKLGATKIYEIAESGNTESVYQINLRVTNLKSNRATKREQPEAVLPKNGSGEKRARVLSESYVCGDK